MEDRIKKLLAKGPAAGRRNAAAAASWGNAVPSQSESAELKRNSIVREAAQCFNRAGFHGTSMDDIATRLGVTKAALYRYVKNKHELLFATFNMAMDSPKLAMFTLLGAINWVPKWYRDDDKWSASEVAESLVDLAIRSIAAQPELQTVGAHPGSSNDPIHSQRQTTRR